VSRVDPSGTRVIMHSKPDARNGAGDSADVSFRAQRGICFCRDFVRSRAKCRRALPLSGCRARPRRDFCMRSRRPKNSARREAGPARRMARKAAPS